MRIIDLRSDTVTLPTPEMHQAMSDAPLGDDVFGEDPTANRLEALAAERTGKPAALLTPSGTMANLAAILTHCGRGDEVILGDQSHTFRYEAGGISAFGGVHPHTIKNQPDGTMALDEIAAAIRPDDVHFPRTRLICLENTQNRCRGAVLTPEYMASVADLAARHGLAVHVDGARIFNAAVALGCDVRQLTQHADSVAFCLSKGLAAPVGSLICGSQEFIAGARRIRKALGGGMRQCGVIAAAGIVALERMVDRLADDHVNARRLAEGIAQIEGLSVDLDTVVTNMVYFYLEAGRLTGDQLVRRLDEKGVKCLALGAVGFRMVTHYGIEPADIDTALQAMRAVMGGA
ncbi:MAG: low-specificity L-threonine aldolase [Phycisphaerae bacterium]|nr:low-specificity L-threonine aldolase [Phycisphaerae bacterium]